MQWYTSWSGKQLWPCQWQQEAEPKHCPDGLSCCSTCGGLRVIERYSAVSRLQSEKKQNGSRGNVLRRETNACQRPSKRTHHWCCSDGMGLRIRLNISNEKKTKMWRNKHRKLKTGTPRICKSIPNTGERIDRAAIGSSRHRRQCCRVVLHNESEWFTAPLITCSSALIEAESLNVTGNHIVLSH